MSRLNRTLLVEPSPLLGPPSLGEPPSAIPLTG